MEHVPLYEDALGEVLRHAAALPLPAQTEPADLLAAAGCILAEPILAERDQPPFPRSTRDGYAVRSADLFADGTCLQLLGTLRAGEEWTGAPLRPGEAIEIMTGAPVPAGADCVLMVEHADLSRPARYARHLVEGLWLVKTSVPTGAEGTRRGGACAHWPRGRHPGDWPRCQLRLRPSARVCPSAGGHRSHRR